MLFYCFLLFLIANTGKFGCFPKSDKSWIRRRLR